MPVFRLVPDRLSHETIDALEQLLAAARRKELSGIAFIAAYGRKRDIVANATGLLYNQPDLARGYLAHLHDLLGRLARDEPMPPGW